MKQSLFFLRSFLILVLPLLLLTSCEQRKTIVNGLNEREANEIIVFLDLRGIDASKAQAESSGGGGGGDIVLWNISVSEERATEAMAILNANGLPKIQSKDLLGIFKDSGLVPSELQEKVRYQAGLAEQMAGTIRKIDGILDADVRLSFPEEDPLNPGETKGEVTASVYVKHQGVMDDPNSHLETKIKRLVSSSINGLRFDNVTVITDRAIFNDATLNQVAAEREWKRVWGIIVAEESLTLFRVIFFSLSILLLSLTLTLIWIIWKLFPIIQSTGGIQSLLSLDPLTMSDVDMNKIKDAASADGKDKPLEKAQSKKEIEEEEEEEDYEDDDEGEEASKNPKEVE